MGRKISVMDRVSSMDENNRFVLYDPDGAGDARNPYALPSDLIDGWNITSSESALGLTSANLDHRYKPGNPIRYGADATKATNSNVAFQRAIDVDHWTYIPEGDFLITESIQVVHPKTIKFAPGRGHRVADYNPVPEQAKIFLGANINLFDIQSEEVRFFGGHFDTSGVTSGGVSSHTKAIFYYPMVTNGGSAGGNADYGGWSGGAVGFIVRGFDYAGTSTQKPEGIGTIVIHMDCINSTTDNAYLYFHDWKGVVYNCHQGFFASARPDPGSGIVITANNCTLDLQVNHTLQAIKNQAVSGMTARIRHQGRHIFSEAEANANASIESDYGMHFKEETRFYDFGKAPLGSGLWTNQVAYDLRAECSFDEFDFDDEGGKSINLGDRKSRGPIGNTTGFFPRRNGNYQQSCFIPEIHDIFWPWAASATVTMAAYQGQADVDTAVSDCVFANASGADVDITSALGSIPSLLVGEMFTIEEHSETENNGKYKVLSAITDGYNCEKQSEYRQRNYVINPTDASSEAVNLVTGYEAMTDDSVTESIGTSSDITLANTDGLFQTIGNVQPTATWNAQAVTDGDYVEIYVAGGARAMQKLWIWISNTDDRHNDKIQLIRKTTIGGATIDNVLIDVWDLPETQSGQRYFEIDLSGSGTSRAIIRYIGLTEAAGITVGQIFAAHSFFQHHAPTVFRDSPGTIYGDMHMNSSDWDGGTLIRQGDYRLWVDSSGRLRIKDGAPSSETDGTIVGTQS